jgi:anaphase-promoting complex subunit 5
MILTPLQSLENVDHLVTGKLYSFLGDSYIGIAGTGNPLTSQGIRQRALHVSRAETYIDRARECKSFPPNYLLEASAC